MELKAAVGRTPELNGDAELASETPSTENAHALGIKKARGLTFLSADGL